MKPELEERLSPLLHVPIVGGAKEEEAARAMPVTEVHRNLLAREEELRRSQHYLGEAQRLSHIGSWAFNAAGFGYWSPELFKIYGLDPGGKAPSIPEYLALVHPEDRDFVVQEIEKMLAAAEGFDFQKRIVRPDGPIRYVRCVGSRATPGGIPEFVGMGMDVTEHELLTQELRRREAYLAEAQRLSHTGSWAWSPDSDVRHWSEECYRVLGFDPREGLPRIEELFQRIHPGDQPAFRESAVRAKHEKKLDEEVDYRVVHPNGAVRDIHTIGHPVFSPSAD